MKQNSALTFDELRERVKKATAMPKDPNVSTTPASKADEATAVDKTTIDTTGTVNPKDTGTIHGGTLPKNPIEINPKDTVTANTDDETYMKSAKEIVENLTKNLGFKTTQQAPSKSASPTQQKKNADPLKFSDEFHIKLASWFISTDEGREIVEELISKSQEKEALSKLLKEASEQEQLHAKQQQQLLAKQAFEQEFQTLSAEEKDIAIKASLIHSKATKDMQPFEKAAYEQGVADAAMLAADPAMMQQVTQMDPAAMTADAPPTPEEILQVLQMLVEQGAISIQEAEAIAMEVIAATNPEIAQQIAEQQAVAMNAASAAKESQKLAFSLVN